MVSDAAKEMALKAISENKGFYFDSNHVVRDIAGSFAVFLVFLFSLAVTDKTILTVVTAVIEQYPTQWAPWLVLLVCLITTAFVVSLWINRFAYTARDVLHMVPWLRRFSYLRLYETRKVLTIVDTACEILFNWIDVDVRLQYPRNPRAQVDSLIRICRIFNPAGYKYVYRYYFLRYISRLFIGYLVVLGLILWVREVPLDTRILIISSVVLAVGGLLSVLHKCRSENTLAHQMVQSEIGFVLSTLVALRLKNRALGESDPATG